MLHHCLCLQQQAVTWDPANPTALHFQEGSFLQQLLCHHATDAGKGTQTEMQVWL